MRSTTWKCQSYSARTNRGRGFQSGYRELSVEDRSRLTACTKPFLRLAPVRAYTGIFSQCSFDVPALRPAHPTISPTTPALPPASLHLTLLFHSHALPFVGPFPASASDRSPLRTLLHPREVTRHAVGTRLVVIAHRYSLFWQWNWKRRLRCPRRAAHL